MSKGEFYELHYKVDPSFYGAGLPGGGPGWSGARIGLKKYGKAGRLWHGAPRPLKLAAGGSIGTVGAGGAYIYPEDDE